MQIIIFEDIFLVWIIFDIVKSPNINHCSFDCCVEKLVYLLFCILIELIRYHIILSEFNHIFNSIVIISIFLCANAFIEEYASQYSKVLESKMIIVLIEQERISFSEILDNFRQHLFMILLGSWIWKTILPNPVGIADIVWHKAYFRRIYNRLFINFTQD